MANDERIYQFIEDQVSLSRQILATLTRIEKQLAEPGLADMKAALGSTKETFAFGRTIRKCIDCGCPVAGGPTRCERCAEPHTS